VTNKNGRLPQSIPSRFAEDLLLQLRQDFLLKWIPVFTAPTAHHRRKASNAVHMLLLVLNQKGGP
jgi:hypothetical protein